MMQLKDLNRGFSFDSDEVLDMRMDKDGNLYILEINSLPSMGEHGSYVAAAEAMGMNFAALVNRLVEVASARYFGTRNPPQLSANRPAAGKSVFAYLTQRRDQIEKRIEHWVNISSRSDARAKEIVGVVPKYSLNS